MDIIRDKLTAKQPSLADGITEESGVVMDMIAKTWATTKHKLDEIHKDRVYIEDRLTDLRQAEDILKHTLTKIAEVMESAGMDKPDMSPEKSTKDSRYER